MTKSLQKPGKKQWLKFISEIDDPHYCEALITQLEARKHQLGPDFKSYTPQ